MIGACLVSLFTAWWLLGIAGCALNMPDKSLEKLGNLLLMLIIAFAGPFTWIKKLW